ncbi:hypothetical protein GUITHDRAFT_77197 [Guillardia theta CCMP2712]|uniref:Uncharacterized protein n=1 Tax=Guillardia theta (strain CCMP2712) TaxID=905079 RepID=L1IRE5_GUITC|nr:hypothetical protein GUITHDRAFT_77197 [Guillardia theta CCMP2712]EKX38474.1 hypothetical protein GUITHDRAFT_77197 [Guillardia theta CCMP2712]|eukprot:XP_005825454.1 hypothetical protein GUITHDRAFT_77197 [Guillardia theta CCMP2712]
MSKYTYASLSPSQAKHKKYKLVLYDKDQKRIKTVQFGDSRYQDFTQTHNDQLRKYYIARHDNGREDWSVPDTPASCARWILWDQYTKEKGFENYLRRFHLKRLDLSD